ncbi:hypothetical protein RIU76_06560 [Latilactobacillus sakei subsp. sakei]|nr:hypothetical protein [Latilactobacillus sakei]MDR7924387.1 hypothetical protein [Latilactobacillus sakei subsp. sakei]
MDKEYIRFLYQHGELDRDYLELAVQFGQLSQADYDDIIKSTEAV